MIPHVVDLYHGDGPVSFHELQDAGVVGVILKASEGTRTDSAFENFYTRAVSVFGEGCVHSYHFLLGEDPIAQVRHYLSVTSGKPGRWLDYENPACSLNSAIRACHALADKQGYFPGMYGSDADLLGVAIDAGHFSVCPLWIARYGAKPAHKCQLHQYQAGEGPNAVKIGGKAYDLNTYVGKGDCATWMRSLAR